MVDIAILGLAISMLAASTYLLGFRLGRDRWQEELTRVRLEATQAQRQLHELTKQAFVAMAEEAGLRRPK